jgi:hypothetical protein
MKIKHALTEGWRLSHWDGDTVIMVKKISDTEYEFKTIDEVKEEIYGE